MSKQVLIPLAAGCEELEAVTIIDLLRRADIHVTTASLDAHTDGIDRLVVCSRGTPIRADKTLDDVLDDDFDLIVLPGGLPGADHLNNDARIHQLLTRAQQRGHYIAAICAAPRVLLRNGALAGKKATAFPQALQDFDTSAMTLVDDAVVVDGHVITSKGPGTAIDFALQLIELLVGNETRQQVEQSLQRS